MAVAAAINTNFTATTGNLEKNTKRAEGVVRGFGARIGSMSAVALPNMTRAIAAGVTALGIRGIVNEFSRQIQALDSLVDKSVNLGIRPQSLQQLQFAGELAGVSAEEMGTALARMGRQIGEAADGGKEADEAFKRLGLSAAELVQLSPDEQIRRVADGLAGMDNVTRRTQTAQEIFGRSGARLIAMLSGGRAVLDEAAADFVFLGGTLTDLDLAASDLAGDSMTRLNTAFDNMKKNIVVGAAPALLLFNNSLAETISAAGRSVKAQYALSQAYLLTNQAAGDAFQSVIEGAHGMRARLTGLRADFNEFFGDHAEAAQLREKARASAAIAAGGKFKASDLLEQNWNKIFRDMDEAVKAGEERRKIAAAMELANVAAEPVGRAIRERPLGRSPQPASIERGTAAFIEAVNKASGARGQGDVQKKMLDVEKEQLKAIQGMEREFKRAAAAGVGGFHPANLGGAN